MNDSSDRDIIEDSILENVRDLVEGRMSAQTDNQAKNWRDSESGMGPVKEANDTAVPQVWPLVYVAGHGPGCDNNFWTYQWE